MAFVRVGRNLLNGMGLDYAITIFPIGGNGIWQCLSPRGDVKLSAALRSMDVWARIELDNNLRELPLSTADHLARGLVVFPVRGEPAAGRGNVARARHLRPYEMMRRTGRKFGAT